MSKTTFEDLLNSSEFSEISSSEGTPHESHPIVAMFYDELPDSVEVEMEGENDTQGLLLK